MQEAGRCFARWKKEAGGGRVVEELGSVRETRMEVGLRREENNPSPIILLLADFAPLSTLATQGPCRP